MNLKAGGSTQPPSGMGCCQEVGPGGVQGVWKSGRLTTEQVVHFVHIGTD